MPYKELKALLLEGRTEFWQELANRTALATDFDELFTLCLLRKKAYARGMAKPAGQGEKIRLALLGGYSLYPLHELLEHLCEMAGFPCELWRGDFDNYVSEIMDDESSLYAFAPQAVVLMPSEQRCKYQGNLSDPREQQQAEAGRVSCSIFELAAKAHSKTHAEIIATNFMLPSRHDLGSYRTRTLGSDWSFRKWVNLELGLNAPPYLHICDLEFLANRIGGINATDDRGWFESKQPGAPALLVLLARELAHMVASLRRAPKKVLVLDLDNTLWGGVVADDGMEGIEIGDTSPRGEAFKAFQNYIASLKERGTLLAVCSKNDHAKAAEVFEKHPEMVLKMDDFVAFKANWEPKSENIRQMAAELNLGLDSFVFVDDNPAEVDIVRQFAAGVETLLLGPDPSEYVVQLQDCRFFEPNNITAEDSERTRQYRSNAQRHALAASTTDMDSYLESLQMEATVHAFTPLDAPRLAQLVNKSNQFNLTTRRRSESEIHALISEQDYACFSVRLKDRFGDHGLISILIAQQQGSVLKVDTWLMSCRVLKRQVEEMALNELVQIAKARGCTRLEGTYLPTAKNGMVRDLYAKLGFTLTSESETERSFELDIEKYQPVQTKIQKYAETL